MRTTSARLAATAELAATAKLVAAKLAAGAIVKPASVHRVAAVFAGSAANGAKAGGNPPTTYFLTYSFYGDQVIRENPASRGTETSAEVLVGPPWRMESNAGQQQCGTRLTLTLDSGPGGHSAR